MDLSRLLVMTKKDIRMVTREMFFLYFLIMPILASVVLNAALGTTGTAAPELAVHGEGEIVSLLEEDSSVRVTIVSAEELREGVREGTYDAGLLTGPSPQLLISGESLLNDRITMTATITDAYKTLSGEEESIAFEREILGSDEYSLKVRLMPFLLIMATIIGGLIISTSLIEEREKKTLDAVLVTPLTAQEIILAKSLFGLFIGLILGVIILILNSSFAGGVILIIAFLVLGTLFAVGLGLIAGVVMDNITDLIARMKIFNLFLMFPAFIILFPQIPQWIGKFFPLYYFVHPLLSITQRGAGWADVWWEAVVLLLFDLVVLVLAAKVLRERMLGEKIWV